MLFSDDLAAVLQFFFDILVLYDVIQEGLGFDMWYEWAKGE